MMAVAAAQKNREMFAIKKSYSIEVTIILNILRLSLLDIVSYKVKKEHSAPHCKSESQKGVKVKMTTHHNGTTNIYLYTASITQHISEAITFVES